MMSILDVKTKSDIPPCPAVKGVILDVSEVELSGNSNFKDKFYAIIADETAAISITVYDVDKKPKFMKGMAVILMNVLVKQNFLAVTTKTDVGMTRPFAIPDQIRAEAPKLNAQFMSIATALSSPVKTIATIKGKVVKVSPATTKTVDQNAVAFQEVVLKDKQCSATVAVWEDMVNTLEKGQMVKLSKCKVRLFNNGKRFTTTRSSMCEKLSDDMELNDISSDEESMADEAAAHMEPLVEGNIVAVFDVDPYLACPSLKCNNTKLLTVEKDDKFVMQCKNCMQNFAASACNHYIRATLMIDVQNVQKKVAIFKPQLEKLFSSRGLSLPVSYDREELQMALFDIIPMMIKCNIFNNTIRDVVCKRIA